MKRRQLVAPRSDRGASVLGRRVRVNMAPISSGSRSRSSIWALLGEARLQERLVRRVLQQPAHQVGHARQHGAVGRVDPHAMAAVDQGTLDQRRPCRRASAARRPTAAAPSPRRRRSRGPGCGRCGCRRPAATARGARIRNRAQRSKRRVALPLLQVDRLGPAQPPRGRRPRSPSTPP